MPPATDSIALEPAELARILEPEVGILILRRSPAPAISDEIADLPANALRGARSRLNARDIGGTIARLLDEHDLDPQHFSAWRADIEALAQRFLALTGRLPQPTPSTPSTLRLETLRDDGCRRFHVDLCRLRLLCTYRGPGTEWLDHDQVDRHALISHQPNEAILRQGQPNRLAPFQVAVLKGERFPGNAGRGLVHRSPPIAGTNTVRVLLCIDA
jgi:hypothetical protein